MDPAAAAASAAPAPGDVSPGASPSAAGALTGEAVLDRLAQAVSQLALSSSASSAGGGWKESKFVRQPDVFEPKDMEQEMQMWSDWSFRFKSFMMIQDPMFKEDLDRCKQLRPLLRSRATPTARSREQSVSTPCWRPT